MSLQSSMAVMKAKLAGNTPQLIALAQQGDFEAAAALKEMMDKKAYAQGVANNAAMGQPDTMPVLEQIAGNLDAPPSGIAAYAGGGGPGLDFREGEGILDRAGRRTKEGLAGLINMLRLQPQDAYKGGPPIPTTPAAPPISDTPYRQEGHQYPPQGRVSQIPPKPQPGYTGLAAVAAPPRESSGPPKKSQPVPPAKILAGPPAAEELDDSELLAAAEKLTPLQKERDALREKSRAQLEAAYNDKVKALTPSKFDKIMSFLAGVQEKGGSSAAQALGAGAQKMYGLQKAADAQKTTLKEAWARADLLEQQALVADRMKDVEGAMALRKEAMELRRNAAKDKSDTGLKAAQGRYYDAQTRYTDTIKPIVEQTKAGAAATRAARAGAGAGAGGGAGKPLTEAQRASETRRIFDAMKKDLSNMEVPESVLWARAAAQVEENRLKPAAASPAGPSVKFLGFE